MAGSILVPLALHLSYVSCLTGFGSEGAVSLDVPRLVPPRRVLVADDSALVRDILTRRAVHLGFEVVPCDSVLATRKVDAAGLACAMLDLDLGDGRGTDVAAELRASRPGLPIAFFSSGTPEQTAAARAFGPVFLKPDDLEDAIAWLAALRDETR
jgi:DNA-binding response OmpR family regulator